MTTASIKVGGAGVSRSPDFLSRYCIFPSPAGLLQLRLGCPAEPASSPGHKHCGHPAILPWAAASPKSCLTDPRKDPRDDNDGLNQNKGRVSHKKRGCPDATGRALLCPLLPWPPNPPNPATQLLPPAPNTSVPVEPLPGCRTSRGAEVWVGWNAPVAAAALCPVATSRG